MSREILQVVRQPELDPLRPVLAEALGVVVGDTITAAAIGVKLANIGRRNGIRVAPGGPSRENGSRVWVMVPLRPRTPPAGCIA